MCFGVRLRFIPFSDSEERKFSDCHNSQLKTTPRCTIQKKKNNQCRCFIYNFDLLKLIQMIK